MYKSMDSTYMLKCEMVTHEERGPEVPCRVVERGALGPRPQLLHEELEFPWGGLGLSAPFCAQASASAPTSTRLNLHHYAQKTQLLNLNWSSTHSLLLASNPIPKLQITNKETQTDTGERLKISMAIWIIWKLTPALLLPAPGCQCSSAVCIFSSVNRGRNENESDANR
jgi:hypothetical protein